MATSIELRFLEHSRRRKNWTQYGAYIKPGFLSTQTTKILWKGINTKFLKDEDKRTVTRRELLEYTEIHYSKEADKVRLALTKMRGIPYIAKDSRVIEFIQRGVTEEAVNEALNCLSDPENLKNLPAIRDTLDHAIQIGTKSQDFYDFFATAEARKGLIRENLVPTGISRRLDDEALEGGIAAGEFIVLIGPTGRGKTEALCNLAAGAIRAKKSVLYCTLQDLPDIRIARIIDQILLGWSRDHITSKPLLFQRRIRQLRKKCGRLFIKDFIQSSVSIFEIRAAIEYLRDVRGTSVDLLIIDYFDTMVSHTNERDDNKVFYKIGQSIQRLGRLHGFGCWTASQGNRESLDVDNVRLAHIAGAIAKTRAADAVIGMSQKESEKAEGYMRWEFLKTRITDQLHKITVFKNPKTRRYGERKKTGRKS